MSFESSVERPVIIGMGNDRGISLRKLCCGARRGNRTPMTVRSADFESEKGNDNCQGDFL